MNNELKKEIRGYYLNNMEELIILVNDMYAYMGDVYYFLQELIVYPMDEINYSLDNHTLKEVLECIDYDNFNPFHSWYRWDYNCNLISLSNEELEEEYKTHILEILDVLFTYIDNEGIENAINDFYLSDNLIEIINNFNENIEEKKAYCIQFEINQLPLNKDFSKNSMEIINNYKFITNEELINIYEEFKSQTKRDMEY